ncbi:MAG: FUSC family protein, partial [Pedobacter sp.]
VFVDMVDLFEQVMSTYYNYKKLHEEFDPTGILKTYEKVISKAADALDEIAYSLKTGGIPDMNSTLADDIEELKHEIALLEQNNQDGAVSTLGIIALKNIEVNIENILSRIKTINGYFNKAEKKYLKARKIDIRKFTTRQSFDKKLLLQNLTFRSSIFRHSVRVAIVMLIGFIVSRALDFSHSYWILLTILVISKPGFSLTKQRNYERIVGTVIGALIGMGVLWYIHDRNTLFVILLLCMIGSYSFQRKNYVVSVVFLTPYTLVMFDFLGMGTLSVASERIYDTIIGCGIAFGSSYFLFPNWEHQKLKEGMLAILNANKHYFEQVTHFYFETEPSLTKYKVARKEVYVSTANLASLFQRMLSEPKSKQLFIKELHQFTALNHLLSSYIATLSLYYKDHDYHFTQSEALKPIVNNTVYLMELSADRIMNCTDMVTNVPLIRRKATTEAQMEQEISILEQFELIQKVTYDIYKLTEKIRFEVK